MNTSRRTRHCSNFTMNNAGSFGSPSTGNRLNGVVRARKRPEVLTENVVKKVKALQARLDPRHPSFVKQLSPSQTQYVLAFPTSFCRKYLLGYGGTIILEDENGEQYETRYLSTNRVLTAGWKNFTLAQNLKEGDVLVFHLVREYQFKVYVVRADISDHQAVEGTIENDADKLQQTKNIVEPTPSPCLEELCEANGQPNIVEPTPSPCLEEPREANGQPETEITEDCSPDGSFVDLKNFRIVVNGCCVDSDLDLPSRVKYYDLCYARKSYLHERLDSNHKLAAGAILETVKISSAVAASGLCTSESDLKEWDKQLEGLRLLGMDVGFLQKRIGELLRLSIQYRDSNEACSLSEAKRKEMHLNENIKSLEAKLAGLKEEKIDLQSEKHMLEAHFQKCISAFQEKVKSPF